MKVSVIIRAYNRGYIIAEAIESALNQTYSDLEIVVVDDGSTDNTHEVVERFGSDKVRYIRHHQNRGVGAACNTGIASCTGDAIAILDSDDLWMPEKLEKQVRFLSAHPEVDGVFCDVRILIGEEWIPSTTRLLGAFPVPLAAFPSGGEYLFSARQMYLCLLEEVPIKTIAILIRRDAVSKVGAFLETRSGEDWEFFLRLSRNSRYGYIDEALAIQRIMRDATHKQYSNEDKLFLIAIFSQEKSNLKGDSLALNAVNRGLLSHYRSLSGNYMSSGKHFKSFSTYLKGFVETGNVGLLLRSPLAFTSQGMRNIAKRTLSIQ